MNGEDYIKILKQYKEKPTLINEISSVDEAARLDEAFDAAIEALEQDTVSKASYDHEYFLRKEFEAKIEKLQHQIEEQAVKAESSEDCIARQPLIDNWNCCADMLMGEGDAEIVMGWIFDAPSVTPTQETLNKIREELKVMTSNRGFLSCSVGHIHKEIDNVFDKYMAESQKK